MFSFGTKLDNLTSILHNYEHFGLLLSPPLKLSLCGLSTYYGI
jgi:hypothetical protein